MYENKKIRYIIIFIKKIENQIIIIINIKYVNRIIWFINIIIYINMVII